MYRNKILIILSIVFMTLVLCSCGEESVDITEAKYEPKIVIDGYIYPDKRIENIKITRNFPLNQSIDASQIILSNAHVTLTDLNNERSYTLVYDPLKLSFSYPSDDLTIHSGYIYRLDVNATIDGKSLHASSVTQVPLTGFKIEQRYLDAMAYREKDAAGNVKNFTVRFRPSSGVDFYAISIIPQQADLNSFIYHNAYFKPDSSDIAEHLDNYKYQARWLQNINFNSPSAEYKIEWFDTWFYGDYKVIIYAADRNFADYVITNKSVQEMDGNFHEPKLHIDGDGIGIFASAVADTAYFSIKK